MEFSRRNFVRAAGLSGLALSAASLPAHAAESAQQHAAGKIVICYNENPVGPGKAVLEAMQNAMSLASRYPFTEGARFEDVLARYVKAPAPSPADPRARSVLVGVGSTEVMRSAAYAFLGPDRALVTATPSYGDPVSHATRLKAPVRAVPVDARMRLDLDAMLAAAPGAGLIYVCNPNNPTATAHSGADLAEFVKQVNAKAPQCVVFVDEAYIDYADDPEKMTLIPLAFDNPNVIVARTFSKAFGMAGMRLGYAVGRPETLAKLQPHQLGLTDNMLTSIAGAVALQDTANMAAERRRNREVREFTRKALADLGIATEPSAGNFLFAPVPIGSEAFAAACAKQDVLVGRPFRPMVSHSRITIGTMAEMQRAAEVFRSVLKA